MRWSALRVPGGNQVDGLPPARHTETIAKLARPRWIGVTLAPRRFVIMVDIFMFLVIFHIRSYWFGAMKPFISYWRLISCEYQLLCSTKPWLTTTVCVCQKCWKNNQIFEFQRKFLSKTPGSGNLYFRSFLWRKFQAEDGIRDRSPSRGLGDVYKRQK